MAKLDKTSFGGTPEEADQLLDLVLSGRKTGTCWAARHGRTAYVGKRVILRDRHGQDRAILETTTLELCRFCDVDAVWARTEGEGDLSLDHWRQTHRSFFEHEGHFTEEMELWCEGFRVVESLLPDR